jgi:hypothetical protein
MAVEANKSVEMKTLLSSKMMHRLSMAPAK